MLEKPMAQKKKGMEQSIQLLFGVLYIHQAYRANPPRSCNISTMATNHCRCVLVTHAFNVL